MTVAALTITILALGWTLHARALRRALDRVRAEFDDAVLTVARIAARSAQRRTAILRIARYCRQLRDDLDVADVVGAELAVALHERTPFEMVRQFHARFGVPDAAAPDIIRHRELRLRLIDEEFRELREALDADDVVAVADALADLLYVVIGSALQWGIPLDRVFAEVHRSNMTKDGGGKRADGKILKGPNYSPPDVAGVLGLTSDCHGQHVETPVLPTPQNCRLLGADRCDHDRMTAEETEAVFGKELQR